MLDPLDEQLLDLSPNSQNLCGQLRCLVLQNGAGDDRAGDTASAAECDLGGHEDIWNVLFVVNRYIHIRALVAAYPNR